MKLSVLLTLVKNQLEQRHGVAKRSCILQDRIHQALAANQYISGLQIDSRLVQSGDVFFAYQGTSSDGRDYIDQAVEQGAVCVFSEAHQLNIAVSKSTDCLIIQLPYLRGMLPVLVAEFYDHPSKHLTMVGITGTNGKTSCLHFSAQILTLLGGKVGVIGTLGVGVFPNITPGSLTTPNIIQLQQHLSAFVKQGVEYVIMEVSSHSLVQKRVEGISFDYALFTNLSHDHLDYHQTMESYFLAKQQLFLMPGLRVAIVNGDDDYGRRLVKALPSSVIPYVLYQDCLESDQIQLPSQQHQHFTVQADQSGLTLYGLGGAADILHASIYGVFNAMNIAMVVELVCHLRQIKPQALKECVAQLVPVPGRMNWIKFPQQPSCVVDFAHTADALQKLLITLRGLLPYQGRCICVFGCGGDRDQQKRSAMMQIACIYADIVVMTQDNPRFESPSKIVLEMMAGISDNGEFGLIMDRAFAIEYAITQAGANDIVVIAGKGHENYQLIKGQKNDFSDRETVLKVLST